MTMKKYRFDVIWDRISIEFKLQKFIGLASIIKVTSQQLSNQKRSNSFPLEWGYELSKKYGLNLEWIMEGTGPKSLAAQNNVVPAQKKETTDQIKSRGEENETIQNIKMWIDELAKENPKAKDWFDYDFQQKYPAYTEWLKNRDLDTGLGLPQDEVA